ncbi:hypothetical protein ACFL0Q_04320, partial [Thermodesulfobacteriota bacterium]
YVPDHNWPAMCTQEFLGDRFFYWVYYQQEGIAEAEPEVDIRTSLFRSCFSVSDDRPVPTLSSLIGREPSEHKSSSIYHHLLFYPLWHFAVFFKERLSSNRSKEGKMKKIEIDRRPRYLILVLFILLSNLSIIVINSHAESEALNLLKRYFNEIRSCKNYDEYDRVTRKYAYSDMVKKMGSAEVKSMSQEVKEKLFSIVKNQFFDVKELVVVEENLIGNESIIKYSRKGHSNLNGTATLIKENNTWKIKKVSERLSSKNSPADM